MNNATGNKQRKSDIYKKYRRILRRLNITEKEIEEIRRHLSLLAQIICKYAWKKKFY